jgi:hypothetical protein
MGGVAKENWDTGLIGGRNFILMITWTSWTVGNYVFSIQDSRGLGRLFTVQYIGEFFPLPYHIVLSRIASVYV